MIRIVLDGEPRGKGRPRFLRNPIKRTTAEGKEWSQHAIPDAETLYYEDRLRRVAALAMRDQPPLLEALSVRVTARCSIPPSYSKRKRLDIVEGRLWPTQKPDADNIAKMLDSLNKFVWADDKQIVDLRVVKAYSERPALEIEIWTLTELF